MLNWNGHVIFSFFKFDCIDYFELNLYFEFIEMCYFPFFIIFIILNLIWFTGMIFSFFCIIGYVLFWIEVDVHCLYVIYFFQILVMWYFSVSFYRWILLKYMLYVSSLILLIILR